MILAHACIAADPAAARAPHHPASLRMHVACMPHAACCMPLLTHLMQRTPAHQVEARLERAIKEAYDICDTKGAQACTVRARACRVLHLQCTLVAGGGGHSVGAQYV